MNLQDLLLNRYSGFSDTRSDQVTLLELVANIRDNAVVKDATDKYRYFLGQGQTTAAGRVKQSMLSFAVPAMFPAAGRKVTDIIGMTGLIMVDADKVDPEAMPEALRLIKADAHTVLCHVTVGGHGIRVLACYPLREGEPLTVAKQRYNRAFMAANAYYTELTGLPTDLQCKNPTRISVLAHDPEVYFNPDALPFEVPDEEPAKTRAKAAAPSRGKAAAADSYEAIYAYLLKLLADKGFAYTPGHRNNFIMRLGYQLNLYGVPMEVALTWANTQWPDYGRENMQSVLRSCYDLTDEFGTRTLRGGRSVATAAGGGERAPRTATVAEIEAFLPTQGDFRYNIVSRQIEVRLNDGDGDTDAFVPLTDRIANTLRNRMCKQVKYALVSDIYTVLHSEFVPPFDPIRSYIEALPAWDGTTDYVAQVAATVQVDGDAARWTECLRKWAVALVAAYFDAEVVNHEILVFIGRQGNYKTTWFQRLLPPPLRRYFHIRVRQGKLDKDDVIRLSKYWVSCLEEIDEMSPSELNTLKAMVTTPNIDERLHYGRNDEHMDHIASFCATGNNRRFLIDRTGNRRWLVFLVTDIASPYTTPIPYDGFFAQLYALYRQGFRYWFDRQEIDELSAENERFEAPNMERELIQTYYRVPERGETGTFATISDIIARIGVNIKQPMQPQKVGVEMSKLGFERTKKSGMRGYVVYEYTMDQVIANRHFTREPDAIDQKLPF
jgi:hypothetical protein